MEFLFGGEPEFQIATVRVTCLLPELARGEGDLLEGCRREIGFMNFHGDGLRIADEHVEGGQVFAATSAPKEGTRVYLAWKSNLPNATSLAPLCFAQSAGADHSRRGVVQSTERVCDVTSPFNFPHANFDEFPAAAVSRVYGRSIFFATIASASRLPSPHASVPSDRFASHHRKVHSYAHFTTLFPSADLYSRHFSGDYFYLPGLAGPRGR